MMLKMFFILVVSGIFVYFRIIFQHHDSLQNVIAAINIIALSYVLFDIILGIYKQKNKSQKNGIGLRATQKHHIMIRKIALFISCLVVILFGVMYYTTWASSLYNDIISVIALCLALISNEIICCIGQDGEKFYE